MQIHVNGKLPHLIYMMGHLMVVEMMKVYNKNKACSQHSHNATVHWNSQKY